MDKSFFDGAFKAQGANMPRPTADDYMGEDGLIHCHVCHEPKQLRLTFPEHMHSMLGAERIVPRNCACRWAVIHAENEAREKAEAQIRIDRLRSEGLANSQYRGCTFAADDGAEPKIRDICLRYVKKWEQIKADNIGIAFVGGTGTGKTFWAAAIANALIDNGVEVLMTTIAQLSAKMMADYGDNRDYVLEQIRRVPLLILDDVGFERNTSTAMEKAYEVVNERYKAGKPLIITTNLSKSELENASNMTDSRIYDRIIEMCGSMIIEVKNKRRKGIATEKRQRAIDILMGADD